MKVSKKLKLIVWLLVAACVASLWITNSMAQETPVIPDALMNKPLSQWQLNGVTIFVVLTAIGRGYHAIANGGGFVGIWKALVFGTNTPKQP